MKTLHYLVNTFLFFALAIAQTMDIGIPSDGQVIFKGYDFTAQIIKPSSMMGCIEVGIVLSINSCDMGTCPQPDKALGNVLYSGPWTPTSQGQGQAYENFTLTLPESMNEGPAVFILTHLCLIGAGPTPLLEFRNASVVID